MKRCIVLALSVVAVSSVALAAGEWKPDGPWFEKQRAELNSVADALEKGPPPSCRDEEIWTKSCVLDWIHQLQARVNPASGLYPDLKSAMEIGDHCDHPTMGTVGGPDCAQITFNYAALKCRLAAENTTVRAQQLQIDQLKASSTRKDKAPRSVQAQGGGKSATTAAPK